MIYNKADFNRHISTLKIDHFKLKSAIQAYLFVREKPNRTETITISYKDYAPHGFYIAGVSADVYFNEVENIMNELLDKYHISQRYGNTTIQKSFQALNNINYKILDTQINDDNSFRVVASEIEKIVSTGSLPFFEKFVDLNAVSAEVSKMSEDDLSNFISGIVSIKVPLIKRLTQSSDYLIELKQRQKFYQEEVFKYPQYFKDHDKVFNDLFSQDLKQLG